MPDREADSVDEALLIQRAKQGHAAAFEGLYRRHVGRVFGLCLRLVSDRSRAEELTQDVFVSAWQKLGSFDGRSKLSSWLHRIAVNTVWSDLRLRLRREELDQLHAAAQPPPSASGSGRSTATAIDLERAIGSLPARARMVLVLFELYGHSHPEIAEQLGISAGGSKAQLHRARNLLRQRLSD